MANEDKQEGHGKGYVVLKQKRTLREVLEVATSFEKVAHEFYSDLIDKVGGDIRYLVEDLAAEELQHYHLFLDLLEDPNVLAQIEQKIAIPKADEKFTYYTHLPELDENPDDLSILQYALGREDAAMNQYQQLANEAPDGPLKSVFQFLAYEEAEHKQDLEKIYTRLIKKNIEVKK